MINQTYKDIVTPELAEGALIHDTHDGFKADYLVLHCLLRRYRPMRIVECGTNVGSGINVIATALPEAKIFSIDLDYETMKQDSKQYPLGPGGEDRVGSAARFPYTQIRADSTLYDYRQIYPIEGWWIDSEHRYITVYLESEQAYKSGAKIIIWHDSDLPEVWEGITSAKMMYGEGYELYRVDQTRISYCLRQIT